MVCRAVALEYYTNKSVRSAVAGRANWGRGDLEPAPCRLPGERMCGHNTMVHGSGISQHHNNSCAQIFFIF